MDAFIAFDQSADFIGKQATLLERAKGPDKKLVTLVVETNSLDCSHDEAVFHAGVCVGNETSGGDAHYVKKSVAMAYVPTHLAKEGQVFEIEMLGVLCKAKLTSLPLYDPAGAKMKAL